MHRVRFWYVGSRSAQAPCTDRVFFHFQCTNSTSRARSTMITTTRRAILSYL